MNNKETYFALSLLFVPAIAQAHSMVEEPNILIIMTDQQNFDMMSCAGNKYLKTPNMDKIAKNGYRFEKCYSVNPVSMPARFSLLTGRYSSEVGIRENGNYFDKEKLKKITPNALGNVFRSAGYETVYAGKTHLYSNENNDDYGFKFLTENPYAPCADAAEEFFSDRTKEKSDSPFLLFLSFLNPHDICYDAGMDKRYPDNLKNPDYAATTKRYLNLKASLSENQYKKQVPPPTQNMALIQSDRNDPEMVDPRWIKNNGYDYNDFTKDQQNLFNWMYCRLTESVDELVGRVLVALEKSGYSDNTIIVFVTDHGELRGAHGLVHKSAMLEECQRIPFMFCGKGIKRNVLDKNTLTCNGLDFLPTLCDLANIEIPKNLPGISLKYYLTGRGVAPKRNNIVTENYNGYQITDGENKLSVFEYEGNPYLMTNIKDDPLEKKNLLKDKKYSNIRFELKRKLFENLQARNLLPLALKKPTDKTIEQLKKTKKNRKDD